MADSARTLGASHLKKVSEPRVTTAEIAKMCGVTTQTVYTWLRGTCVPPVRHALVLEARLGIPVREWVTSANDNVEDSEKFGGE